MKEYIEKMKKEYATPQMEVMDFAVQNFLCNSPAPDNGDLIVED